MSCLAQPARRIAILAASLLLAALAADAEERLPAPGAPAWEPLEFPKIERHTRYEALVDPDGTPVLRADSECAASGRVLRLENFDLAKTPRLSWRWRLRTPTGVADERSKEGDDFAARVYIVFAYDPKRVSFLERAARGVAKGLYGRELPGDAINYVWTHGVAPGERWPNPFSNRAHMVALRRGEAVDTADGWVTEVVDLAADRAALLEPPLPAIEAIALMSDSDNSCGRAGTDYADFRLLGPAE